MPKNISICGGGTIYGNADGWFSSSVDDMGYRTPAEQRPRMILLENCQRVRLEKYLYTPCADVDNSSCFMFTGGDGWHYRR